MKICAICGQPWDECCGECQGEITLKQKVDYLRSLERKEEEDAKERVIDRATRIRKDS